MAGTSGVVTAVNYGKGVRFDHFGLYGYDTTITNNKNYVFNPHELGIVSSDQLFDCNEVVFGLTWNGLKITTPQGGKALIGSIKHMEEGETEEISRIIEITRSNNEPTFVVEENGSAAFYGDFYVYDIESNPLLVVDQTTKQVLIGGWNVSDKGLEYQETISTFNLRRDTNKSRYAALSG